MSTKSVGARCSLCFTVRHAYHACGCVDGNLWVLCPTLCSVKTAVFLVQGIKYFPDNRTQDCVCLNLSVCVINLQCLLWVIIKQDVASPPLLHADVVELKLHSWKHLFCLLRDRKKTQTDNYLHIPALRELSNTVEIHITILMQWTVFHCIAPNLSKKGKQTNDQKFMIILSCSLYFYLCNLCCHVPPFMLQYLCKYYFYCISFEGVWPRTTDENYSSCVTLAPSLFSCSSIDTTLDKKKSLNNKFCYFFIYNLLEIMKLDIRILYNYNTIWSYHHNTIPLCWIISLSIWDLLNPRTSQVMSHTSISFSTPPFLFSPLGSRRPLWSPPELGCLAPGGISPGRVACPPPAPGPVWCAGTPPPSFSSSSPLAGPRHLLPLCQIRHPQVGGDTGPLRKKERRKEIRKPYTV